MSSPSNPIRVGLIGLNAAYPNDIATGTSWAAAAHLPYLKWSPKYRIVALQNSSAARAKEAIAQYDLPATTKAYGRPEDLANDPDVDLVVCCIRVDKHATSVIPSIKAGKAVFVEWPLETNVDKARELADVVAKYEVRNMVGAQGAFSLGARQLKRIIDSGVIGRLRSSNVFAQGPWGGPQMPSNVDYFVDKEVGGNIFTIAFGHFMEIVSAVLGDVKDSSSMLINHYPEVDILKAGTHEIAEKGRKNTSPDQVMLNAILDNGVALNFHLQCGAIQPKPFKSTESQARKASPDLDWRIFGDKGEIRVISPSTWPFNAFNEDLRIQVLVLDETAVSKEQTEEVEKALHPQDELEEVPVGARNVGRLYEAFAAGPETTQSPAFPTFEHAVKKHQLIDDMYRRSGF